jgi:phosphoesterase RecJ-like protein
LIFKLFGALGLEITCEEAEFLFFGLCTDTGFFRHVDSSGAETFDFAAALIRRGANPKTAYTAIHDGKSLDSRKLLGNILVRSESLFGGKLIMSSEEYEETCRFGMEGRDSDSMYKLFQAVAGVEAVAIIRQETPERCSVGLRSRSWADVGNVAKSFGGGGHKNAAGFGVNGTINEIKPKLIDAFGRIF